MQNCEKFITDLYSTDLYITKNPSLHEEHAAWKVNKIIEVLDKYVGCFHEELNLLDVGGGAGYILKSISEYLETSYRFRVKRFAIDLSPTMIEVQKARNPILRKALVEDIRRTSLNNKEIDLMLAIDLLEHVANPQEALGEMRRISKYAMLKVPLEDNVCLRTKDFFSNGRAKRRLTEQFGHVNFYNLKKLKQDIGDHLGDILYCGFTNAFAARLHPEYIGNLRAKVRMTNFIGLLCFKVSPRICSYIFNDFVLVFVKCY